MHQVEPIECMAHGSWYTVHAFDSNSDFDSNTDYEDSGSYFYYSDIVFMELVAEESVVVMELGEDAGTAVDIGKVAVGTERRPYVDKESTAYGP